MRIAARHSPEAEHTVWWLLLCRAVERAAREAEREACARVCEETTAAWTQPVYNAACMDCATAIRNRAEGEPK